MFPNSANLTLCLGTIINKVDALGIRRPFLINKKTVVGINKSITSSEYQTSIMMNVRVDYKVVIQSFLYSNQKFALINDEVYKIERTYLNGQFIELYLSLSDYKLEDLNEN